MSAFHSAGNCPSRRVSHFWGGIDHRMSLSYGSMIVALVCLTGCQSLSWRSPIGQTSQSSEAAIASQSSQATVPSSIPTQSLHATPQQQSVSTPRGQMGVPNGFDGRSQIDRSVDAVRPVGFRPSGDRSSVYVGDDCETTAMPGHGRACVRGNACQACRDCQTRPHGYAMPAVPPRPRIDPQEFLCDGGDRRPEARLGRDGRILALQPEDTVTHYTNPDGDVEFAASNRVCVYAPRFGVVRQIRGAVAGEKAVAAIGVERPVGPIGIDINQPGLVVADSTELVTSELTRRVDSMRERNRGVPIENVQQPLQAEDVLAVLAGIVNRGPAQLDEAQLALIQEHAAAALAWTIDESVEVAIEDLAPPVLTRDQHVDALVQYQFPDGRLSLIKMADRQHAGVGETVSFLLRLQNVGDSAVSGVVVTDNLTTRLAYVEGSQTSSVPAEFDTKLNSAGSNQLIWTLTQPLPVGETVLFEFECRVR